MLIIYNKSKSRRIICTFSRLDKKQTKKTTINPINKKDNIFNML